ncbi:hypothetical protein M8C21_031924, partial [Ambrosia artemisiifolia]
GCDGSVLLDGSASGPSEKDAPPNLSLRAQAFVIIENLRRLVHNACNRTVSCSDITALAARDAVFLSGGPNYSIPLGRRDGLTFATRNVTLANLPPPFANTTTILNSLSQKGFTPTDVVALSGGHTIGIAHCTSFTARLYPTRDPSMDQTFFNNLRTTCPTVNSTNTTFMDIRSPNVFDNRYYVDLMNRQGLFTSDQDLYTDSRTRSIVTNFAVNQTLFYQNFVNAMIKMGQLSGCDGSVLLDGSASGPTDSEKTAPPNLRLRGFDVIEDLRRRVHKQCGSGSVSCSDIATIVARDSIALTGGPKYNVPLGRRDGLTFATLDATLSNLPSPFVPVETLLTDFAAKNFDTTDVVALSGAHTIGVAHCTSFAQRLYPTQDTTIDKTFASTLKRVCPTATTNATTFLDIRSPNVFDNKYFVDLMNKQGVLTPDQDLYTNKRTRSIVTSFAVNQTLFFEKFVNVMVKMGQMQVLTGTQGEIRNNCSRRNANTNDPLISTVVGDLDVDNIQSF